MKVTGFQERKRTDFNRGKIPSRINENIFSKGGLTASFKGCPEHALREGRKAFRMKG